MPVSKFIWNIYFIACDLKPWLCLFRFRFKYYPEYIGVGEAIVLREDRIRGMGTVTAITPLEDSIIIPE